MNKKNASDISEWIEEALQDDLSSITRSTIGGGLSRDVDVYHMNVTLKSGERFLIAVTKLT